MGKKLNALANKLRADENPYKIGAFTGKVVSMTPPKIEIGNLGIQAELGVNLVIAAHLLRGYRREMIFNTTAIAVCEVAHAHTDNHTPYRLTDDEIKVGDKVIVIASDDNQTFYLVARAVTG